MRLKDLKTIERALFCYAGVCRKDATVYKSDSIRSNLIADAKNYEEVRTRVIAEINKHEAKLRSKTP